MAEALQVEIVLKDPERRGCSAEIENSTLEKMMTMFKNFTCVGKRRRYS